MDIFFEDLNYNIIKQVPAYTLHSVLGKYTLELNVVLKDSSY
jgi:hypothetical protein